MMQETRSTNTLHDLLVRAVEKGVLDGWTISGRYFLFQRAEARFHVHPSVVVDFLRRLIGEDMKRKASFKVHDRRRCA